MKNKAKGRFAILALATLAMMVALIMQLGNLTLAEGETYAKAAESLSTSTMYTTGARGRILDRNGIPLAYDSTSYNVQFYRDPERTSQADSALYTESLIEAIKIIEAGGGEIIDTSYIRMDENGELYYKWGVDSLDGQKARYKNFCNVMSFYIKPEYENDTSKWISAEEAYRKLRKSWQIPEELAFPEAVKIMSIRQEVNLNKWRAYEPVTIAFNVSMEVVAQLDMRKGELLGIQTVQSTSRIYPWGTTAAHILGYMGRQVSAEMSEDGMLRMGYGGEELAGLKEVTTKEGKAQTVIDMTKLGYSYNDYIGVSGIEKTMEKYLTANTNAQRGTQTVEKNKSGTITRALEKTAAFNGDDVMLTIDLPLQTVTEEALQHAITEIRKKEEAELAEKAEAYQKKRSDLSTIKMAETGSIVVLDIHTGKVLAMASYPSFDPNTFVSGLSKADADELFQNPSLPTLNRATASRLAPGSIFKMATGLAGLMEGKITTSTEISDQGPYILYEKDANGKDVAITQNAPHCWATSASELATHQNLNLSGALTKSCNYFFYTVAERLGIDKLNEWSTKLGLSTSTGIELPGELTSHVGGQSVLYDNTAPVGQQKSSLPNYVYNALKRYLKEILAGRAMEVEDKAIEACAEKLLQLQKGETSTQFGPDIRRILNEELGLPIGITLAQNWVSRISSMLTELQWKPTMTIRAGIGQASTLTTPIAIARYAATFGNGGTVYDVHIVDRILDEDGSVVKLYEPTVYNKIDAPEEYWQAIREGLKGVVSPEDRGTAAKAFSEEFRNEETGYLTQIIGKSGTAQISAASNNVDIENTAWFVTLLPRENPEIVIVTCLPYGMSGSGAGGPAIEQIVSFYLDRKTGSAKENLVGSNGLVP